MSEVREQLKVAEQAFNAAMISNDPARISQCITPDWVLVTPERGPIPGREILAVIGAGALTHQTRTKTISHLQVLGNVATVTARGQSTGTYQGSAISADEWITDVYCRVDGRWLCALTHLTPAARSHAEPV